MLKCVVILRDFFYNNALFGLVSYFMTPVYGVILCQKCIILLWKIDDMDTKSSQVARAIKRPPWENSVF